MKLRSNLLACSCLAVLVGPGIALAQPATPPPGAAASTGSELAEIVVTAQKRAQLLQDVPVTVSAVTPETLTKAGVDSTASIFSVVPGVNINNAISGFRPFIRGVGTTSAAAGNENSVSTYIDNIYLTSLNAGLLNLTSIQSIEVLMGPQGTLFGRNATGGVIHIKTKDPSQTFGGDASVSYGNYKTLTATAYVTGGLTENLAADLAIYYRKQGDGYGVNLATGHDIGKDDNFTIRTKWLFRPTDKDTFTFSADYSKTLATGNVQHPFPGTTTQWGPPDATHPLPAGAPYVFPGGTWDIAMANDPFFKSWFGGGSLTYTHDFSWASLSSFTAYRESRIRQAWNATPIPTNAQYAGWNQPEQQFSQELQLSSLPESKVAWILGLYYLDASVRYDPFFISGLALAPIEQHFRMKQTIKSPAAYGQFTVPVEALGDTNITGGLRYTVDERAIVGRIEITSQADPSTVLRVVNPTDASKTFRTFTWRLSMDHHFTPDLMAYISYNRGFKAGTFNTIPPGGPNAKSTNPEFLDAYEIGMKNTLFGGRATFNLSAFLYDYKDMQVTIFNQSSATTINAAAADIKGIDVDLNAQVTENLRLTIGAEFLDHKFADYKNGPILTALTLAQGGGLVRAFGDLSGNRLPYTSDAVINVGAYYKLPTAVGDFDANANFTWNDGFTFEPSEVVSSGSFVDLNATAGWTLTNHATRISVFGRNLTNAKVPRTVTTGANPGGYISAIYRPPRTYGVSLSHSF
ncbi:MAG TPA: TonB-dependent receptor [Phenylobacterium sp.]|nr:TonB-dependent receptor [Phenylobacterium sp.]